MTTARILVVEDDPLLRLLLCRTLAAEPGFTVVGETSDGVMAIGMVSQTKPDVILVDIKLSVQLGVDYVAKSVNEKSPNIAIVVLSSRIDHRYVFGLPLRERGAWAYLLKQTVSSVDTLMDVIKKTQAGLIVLDPQIANSLKAREGSPVARLSPSRMEVLRLIAQGYNNAAIARHQNLSVKSVENYINDIYQEFGLKDMSELHARVKATLIYLEST